MPGRSKVSPVTKPQVKQKPVDKQPQVNPEPPTTLETPVSNHYSLANLSNQVARARLGGPNAVMALQRTYGNRVTARVLNAATVSKQASAIQRIPALPTTTKPNLADPTPSYDDIRLEGVRLWNWVLDVVQDDAEAVKKAGSPVNTALAYKPRPLAMAKLKPLWDYGEADATAAHIVDPALNKTARKVAREKTVKYFLLQSLWQEVAKSTARRIQKHAGIRVGKLRRKMAVEAAQAGGGVVDASKDGAALKEYKKKILGTYEHQIKKQEELAKKITYQVAYVVAQGQIKEDDDLVKQYIETEGATYLNNLAQPLSEKLQKVYDEKITKPVASLNRKKARIKVLSDEIDANDSMWDMTKRKYKGKLLTEYDKLEKADYKTKLFDKAGTIAADMELTAQTEATNAIEPFKFKAAEEVLSRFKAGKASLKANNTENRHLLKEDVTDLTTEVLKGKAGQITTFNALGDQEDVDSAATLTKAKETAVKDSLEGPIHSRLRHVGKVVSYAVPQDGDKAKMEFTLKVPVGDPTGGGYLGMRLLGQVEHEIEWDEEKDKKDKHGFMKRKKDKDGKNILKADTYKVKAELALIGGYRVPFVFDAGGEVGGYLEIESDKGMERAMEMVSFGFYRRFRESKVVPHKITDALWGMGGDSVAANGDKSKAKTEEAKAWGNAYQESLSSKEFIETGAFGAGTATASVTDAVSFKGGLKGYSGKRYNKFSMDALAKGKESSQKKLKDKGKSREKNLGRHMYGSELSFEFNIGPFAIAGKIKGSRMQDQAGDNLDKKYRPDQIDTTIGDLKQQIATAPDPTAKAKLEKELATVVSIKTLLTPQWYSLETEASAASKGGSSANASQIAAESLKWAAELGAKLRTSIMSFKDQYAGDKKIKSNASGFFDSAIQVVTAGTNNAATYNQAEAADKLQKSQELISNQMSAGLTNARNNTSAIDKMHQFAAKSTGGLKLTFKHSTKREFETIEEGAKTSKYYPSKFELTLDQVSGGTLGSQIAIISLEKATRLLRLGVKYKDGNFSRMTV